MTSLLSSPIDLWAQKFIFEVVFLWDSQIINLDCEDIFSRTRSNSCLYLNSDRSSIIWVEEALLYRLAFNNNQRNFYCLIVWLTSSESIKCDFRKICSSLLTERFWWTKVTRHKKLNLNLISKNNERFVFSMMFCLFEGFSFGKL